MEKKEFPISRLAFTRSLAIRLIPALYFLMLFIDYPDISNLIVLVVVIVPGILMITWTVHFLKRPHKIIIDDREIVFKSLLFKPIRIDVDNLLSIIEVGAGGYTRFNSEKKSLVTLSEIKNRDTLFKYIHFLNSNIKVKQVTGTRKALGALGRVLPTVIVLFIVGMVGYTTFREYRNSVRTHYHRINAEAKMDLKNAFTAAQWYFEKHPNGVVTLLLLNKYGFVQSEGVKITIISGTKNGLKISSTHSKGDKIYEVDAEGKITFRKKE